MLNNTVILTDDELTVIQTSLQFNIIAYEEYKRKNGDLDYQSQEVLEKIKALQDRFKKKYF